MTLRKHKILLFTFCLLISQAFVSCEKNKEQLSEEVINSYEHTVYALEVPKIGDEEEAPVIDADGFYVTDDLVYVDVDTVIYRSSPSTDAESMGEGSYGEELHRTGTNEDGWYRIALEEGIVYIRGDYVTEMKLDFESEFTYSLASLDIVDTSRQFYSYDELAEDMAEIRKQFGEVCSLGIIGLSADGRNIYELSIGNPEAEHELLIVGGMAGCEYMTSLFAAKLCEYYAHYANEGIYNGFSYSELFDKCLVRIIPMLDPDGVAISQFNLEGVRSEDIKKDLSAWFERDQVAGGTSLSLDSYLMFYYANARGVELTKNFPYGWDEEESIDEPSSKGYKGDSAASENETAALIRLIDETAPDVLIALRTTGNKLSHNYAEDAGVKAKADELAAVLADKFSFVKDDEAYVSSALGSLEAYASREKLTPAIRIMIGNGDAPLSLNEYNSIWNSGRESVAALMASVLK